MQITVTGRHLDVGQALRQHVEDELETAVSKYFEKAMDATVTLTKTGAFIHAEISVHVGRGILVQSNAESGDPYGAFAGSLDRIAKRLRRYKRRLRDHHNAMAHDIESQQAQQYILAGGEETVSAGDNDGEAAAGEPAIIAEMAMDVPSLSVGEAVMRMDLADQPAFMFRNRAHGGLNMIYRRADGNIGWVDPRGTRENTK
jgi:ribosomal subunit interface protein